MSLKHEFLKTFLRLFNARIERYEITESEILGVVSWIGEEEDKQEFCWHLETWLDNDLLHEKSLCEYLITNELINGDLILLPEALLKSKLSKEGWTEEIAQQTINNLCQVEVKMVDDGIETDSFFLHF